MINTSWDPSAAERGPGVILGGEPNRPALDLAGATITYAQFARQVADLAGATVTGADGYPARTLDATGLPVAAALATVFAAAAAGRPVVVADPQSPRPSVVALPAGVFLVAVTSGSTGRPRAVLRTAASWSRSFAPFSAVTGITGADRVGLTGPLHATLHLFAAVHALAAGATVTDRLETATAVHAVPPVLADLLRRLPATAPLRRAVTAGARLPVSLENTCTAKGIALTEYYGASELSFVAARRCPGGLRPFPGVSVRVDRGVLWARSPYLALGYAAPAGGHRARDGRAGCLPLRITPDGFATVGDRVERSSAGELRILGRGDAAITVGGATVQSEDVESSLAAVPGIRAAGVAGVAHQRLGQTVAAAIELCDGAVLAEVRRAARTVLRAEALPRRWLVTATLPRTPSGKLDRAELAALLARPRGAGTAEH